MTAEERAALEAKFEPDSLGFPEPSDGMLASIAISLKRIADLESAPLVELPLRDGNVAHIRPSRVASVSVGVKMYDCCHVQMIGDTGADGFPVALSLDETMRRLRA